jgi:lactam utilization protein B
MPHTDIAALIQDFVTKIIAATEADAANRVQGALAGAFTGTVKRGPGRPGAGKSTFGRRPMKVSAKVTQARKLQGQYLGALRGLTQANRAKVKAVAKTKGVPEALKLVASLKPKR